MDALGVKPLFVFIKPLFGFFAMVSGIHFLLLDAAGSEFGIVMKLLKHGAGDAEIGVHTNEVHEFEGAHFEAAAFERHRVGSFFLRAFFEGFEAHGGTLFFIYTTHLVDRGRFIF